MPHPFRHGAFLRAGFAAIALSIAAIAPCLAQEDMKDFLRPQVRLEDVGQPTEVLVNCPWNRALVIKPAKQAPAAVLKCDRNGPGTVIELKD